MVKYYEIVIKQYHKDIVARIRYAFNGELIESQLYSIAEINNILLLWHMNGLKGSFGLHPLSPNAQFQIVEN